MTATKNDPKYGPLISLGSDTKYPFTFGPGTAQMIIENLEAVRAFAAAHPAKVKTAPQQTPFEGQSDPDNRLDRDYEDRGARAVSNRPF